jgi:hypothetical protein
MTGSTRGDRDVQLYEAQIAELIGAQHWSVPNREFSACIDYRWEEARVIEVSGNDHILYSPHTNSNSHSGRKGHSIRPIAAGEKAVVAVHHRATRNDCPESKARHRTVTRIHVYMV